MGFDEARAHLGKYGLEENIHLTEESSATVELAAKALGTEPARIAKSLTFLVGEKAVMILAAGDTKIDNSKYKAEFGCKAKMLPSSMVEEMIGHPVGGVCPFGCKDQVEVYLDTSLKRFDHVYPAAGTPSSGVKLTCEELERASVCKKWIDVTKLV